MSQDLTISINFLKMSRDKLLRTEINFAELESTSLRGESKFEKCTVSVKLTFRGWWSNSNDASSAIHVSLIPINIVILTKILTLIGQGWVGLRIKSV